MRRALIDMRPDRFEDIIALVALYRPGPMANIPTYCARKRGTEQPDYIHPKLEPILRETFGVIIYQEQVMQAAQVLAGYSLGEADLLRRAMGKKIRTEMQAQRDALHLGRDRARRRARAGGGDLRVAGTVRRLRLQQEPRGGLCAGRLSDRLYEGELSGRVPGRVDDARHGQYRQACGISRRGRAARHHGRAAVGQQLRRRRSRSSDGNIYYALAALKGVGRQAVESHRRGARRTAVRGPCRFRRIASIRAPSTSACWKASRRPARSMPRARSRARLCGRRRDPGRRAAQPRGGERSARTSCSAVPASASALSIPARSPGCRPSACRRNIDAVGFFLTGHPLDDYAPLLKGLRRAVLGRISASA